jgi:hypothetical protein
MKSIKGRNLESFNVGVMDGSDLLGISLNGLRWHDIHTKFHGYWFGHSGNIKAITLTISEDAALV